MIRNNNISDNANIAMHKIMGGGLVGPQRYGALTMYVDGDKGNDGNSGLNPMEAKQTIQCAVDRVALTPWSVIYVFPKNVGDTDTDPASYAETLIIPVTAEGLAIIGAGRGRTQGGLPQVKIGGGSTAMLTVRAMGCLIVNMGFNGASSTGGGILMDDNGTTKVAFGLSVINCHFKNCQTSATTSSTGGAIYASADGGGWQVLIRDCVFYKCRGGVCTPAGIATIPQDWIIDNCVFESAANTDVDSDISLLGAVVGLNVRNCSFNTADVPASSGGAVARYIYGASGTKGCVSNCTFNCTVQGSGAKTFGATGNAVVLPTTVRISGCFGECESTSAGNSVLRTL